MRTRGLGAPARLSRLSVRLLISTRVTISRFVGLSPVSRSVLTGWSLLGILSLSPSAPPLLLLSLSPSAPPSLPWALLLSKTKKNSGLTGVAVGEPYLCLGFPHPASAPLATHYRLGFGTRHPAGTKEVWRQGWSTPPPPKCGCSLSLLTQLVCPHSTLAGLGVG